MRRFTRGAAAVAAICAGALTISTAAAVASPWDNKGSGSDATDYRVAGVDRVQTSLEGLEDFNGKKVSVLIVGYQGVVDALSLAPLTTNPSVGKAVVIYANSKGLDSRAIRALSAAKKAGNINEIAISGGPGAVPYTVEEQLEKLGFARGTDAAAGDFVRFNGANRYETSYLTGAFVQDWSGMKAAANTVAYKEYRKRMLPGLKAAFDAAKANLAAKNAADAKAQEALADAAAKYTQELAKVADGPGVKAAVKNLNSAISSIRTDVPMLKKLEGTRSDMAKIELETKVILQTEAAVKGEVDLTLAKVEMYTKKADVKKAIANLIANTATTAEPVVKTDRVGEARKKLEADIDQYNKKIAGYNEVIANAQMTAQAEIAKDAALVDPKSPVSVAARNYLAAKKAKDDAAKAKAAAAAKLVSATAAYYAVFVESFDDFGLAAARKALDTTTKGAYAAGDRNIFLATGLNFADALTAGPAAAAHVTDGKASIVLLSNGKSTPSYVMDAVKGTHRTVYGIGGPAAATYANAVPVFGKDRYATSAKVALKFFNATPGWYALASGEVGADAVVAGAYLPSANMDSQGNPAFKGILLTRKASLPASVADFIQYGNHANNQKPVKKFVVFGGEGAIERGVVAEARALTHN